MYGPRLVIFWLSLFWLVAALLSGTPAIALDPTRSVVQMYHRAYTRDDGLPGPVNSITQSPDGYLWIGSNSGLYRFDGVHFDRIADNRLLSRSILAVKAKASGDLWISYGDGGLSRLHEGAVTNFSTTAEGAELRAQAFVDAPKGGGFWAVGGYGPYRFDGRNWHVMAGPWIPASQGGGLWASLPGPDGTFWGKNGDGVYYCRPGCARFITARGYAGGVMGFSRDREGRVWTSDTSAPGRMYAMPTIAGVSDLAIPGPLYGGQISTRIHGRMFLDRDGTLWNINVQQGLLRVRSILAGRADPTQADEYSTADGLSSNIVTTFFEDREGNIWVGTYNGLDRFRPENVVLERQIPVTVSTYGYNAGRTTDGLYFSASTSQENNTPDSARRGPLYRVSADGSVRLVLSDMEVPATMSRAGDGGLWLSGLSHRLYKLKTNALIAEPMPSSLQNASVIDVVETRMGVVWAATLGHGLWRRANGLWSRVPGRPDEEVPQWNLKLDAQDILWLVDGHTVARYVDGRVRKFLGTAGPNIGAIITMEPDAHGMWFGGEYGLAHWDGRGFQTLRSEQVPALALVSGIVQADGQTWIASQAGILRFDTRTLQHALGQRAASPPYELFDRHDGLSGGIQQGAYSTSTSSAFSGPDGKIWFLTDRGVVWIDPHHIYRNSMPPPVVVRSVTMDGRVYAAPHEIDLPAGASNLEIDYAVLSFVSPGRLAVRYKLDGVDNNWVDPGDRRQVFYTHLGPGSYSFHVIAANEAGVWNRSGATIKFSIAPTFVQSIWFKILVALILVALAWAAYTLRLRQETARLQSRFNVRTAERERIARELHDTLLQGCQGLLLRFQSIANRVPAGDVLHKDIEEALDRADAVLAEGRARVRDLRTSSGASDLAHSLTEAASSIIGGDTPRFQLTVEGKQRSLNALVEEEVLRVFEEAVRNVLKHANATEIYGVLAFGRQALRLSIRDDGVGIVQSKVTADASTGHFGLVGMRERAERIGGQLQVASREGAGTEIVMAVPARLAYKRDPVWRFQRTHTTLSEETV